jgi:hypothetical protein
LQSFVHGGEKIFAGGWLRRAREQAGLNTIAPERGVVPCRLKSGGLVVRATSDQMESFDWIKLLVKIKS